MVRPVTTHFTITLKLKVVVRTGKRVFVAVIVNDHVPTFDRIVIVLGLTVIVK